MLRIRNIDYYGQLILVTCTILSVSFFYFVGVGIGLFLLACWQLISALANTPAFIHTGYRKTHLALLDIFHCRLIINCAFISIRERS
jgi:hypothetical protein